jgi:ubiquitin
MTSKWDELGLQERTKLVNDLSNHFKNNGRPNPNMSDMVKLAEWGYTPRSTDIQMYLNQLISVDELKPKLNTQKPESIEGTLTQACLELAEKNRVDEYKRQQFEQGLRVTPEQVQPPFKHYY